MLLTVFDTRTPFPFCVHKLFYPKQGFFLNPRAGDAVGRWVVTLSEPVTAFLCRGRSPAGLGGRPWLCAGGIARCGTEDGSCTNPGVGTGSAGRSPFSSPPTVPSLGSSSAVPPAWPAPGKHLPGTPLPSAPASERAGELLGSPDPKIAAKSKLCPLLSPRPRQQGRQSPLRHWALRRFLCLLIEEVFP